MVDLDPETVDELRATLPTDREEVLDSILRAKYVGEVANVSEDDGTVRMILLGEHPHVTEASNSVEIGLDRFESEDPGGYYWLCLTDEPDPDVESVRYGPDLTGVMRAYYETRRERRRADGSTVSIGSNERVDEIR